jgi:hypothetical protein
MTHPAIFPVINSFRQMTNIQLAAVVVGIARIVEDGRQDFRELFNRKIAERMRVCKIPEHVVEEWLADPVAQQASYGHVLDAIETIVDERTMRN